MLNVLLSLVWGWRTAIFQLSGLYCRYQVVTLVGGLYGGLIWPPIRALYEASMNQPPVNYPPWTVLDAGPQCLPMSWLHFIKMAILSYTSNIHERHVGY